MILDKYFRTVSAQYPYGMQNNPKKGQKKKPYIKSKVKTRFLKQRCLKEAAAETFSPLFWRLLVGFHRPSECQLLERPPAPAL